MAEIRALRGWSRGELADRLVALADLHHTVPPAPLEQLDVDQGWRVEHSEAVVGREHSGPPAPDGLFERAKQALDTYAFSDPTIVEAHFDPAQPLLGRRMLLELKVLGLRYLCGVRVVDVKDEDDDHRSVFGFRYDTLAGHLERGGEWFEVTKEHATGEIRLCITSRWRLGDMPNAWTRVGFRMLAPYYRGLWLRRAHERLRALLEKSTVELTPRPARVIDEGPPTGSLPPLAQREHASRAPMLAAAAAFGTLTGMRSMSGPTLLAARSQVAGAQPGAGPAERWLAHPGSALTLGVLACAEMVADKTPWIPPSISPPSVAGRIALGALCGGVQARRWRQRGWAPALVGGLAALTSTFVAYRVRQRTSERFGISTVLLGVVEDAVVIAAAATLFRVLAGYERPAYAVTTAEEHRPQGRRRVIA
jgi:uncharacterized membrane protein/uncharacterized protein (UPF0548 family)